MTQEWAKDMLARPEQYCKSIPDFRVSVYQSFPAAMTQVLSWYTHLCTLQKTAPNRPPWLRATRDMTTWTRMHTHTRNHTVSVYCLRRQVRPVQCATHTKHMRSIVRKHVMPRMCSERSLSYACRTYTREITTQHSAESGQRTKKGHFAETQ